MMIRMLHDWIKHVFYHHFIKELTELKISKAKSAAIQNNYTFFTYKDYCS